MLIYILYFSAFMLILAGLLFVIHLIASKLLTGSSQDFFIAVDATKEKEALPDRIYSAFIQVNIMNFTNKRPVVVFSDGLSDQEEKELIDSAVNGCRILFVRKEDIYCSQNTFSIEKTSDL